MNIIKMRQEIEEKIVRSAVESFQAAGFEVSVHDGEVLHPRQTTWEGVRAYRFLCDEEYLRVYERGEKKMLGMVLLVYGNDGWDVICDYTTNLESYLKETNELAIRGDPMKTYNHTPHSLQGAPIPTGVSSSNNREGVLSAAREGLADGPPMKREVSKEICHKIPVTRVTILRREMGTDMIIFNVTDENARTIHADKYDIFLGARYTLDVTKGRGEEVCKALGIPDELVEVINC